MYRIFQIVIRYISNLPVIPLSPSDKVIVVGKSGIPKHSLVSSFLPFAHASFSGDGFDGTLNSSFNVQSVSRSDKGIFVLTFEEEHPTGKYTLISTAGSGNHTSSARAVSIDEMTTTSCTIRVERTDTGTQEDEGYIAVVIY